MGLDDVGSIEVNRSEKNAQWIWLGVVFVAGGILRMRVGKAARPAGRYLDFLPIALRTASSTSVEVSEYLARRLSGSPDSA